MQIIIDFLTGIGDVFVALFRYLFHIVDSAVYVVGMLLYFVGNSGRYFSWLPLEYGMLIGLIFSIAVIYRIRNGD